MSYAQRFRAQLGRWESEFGRSNPVIQMMAQECHMQIKTLCHNKKHTHPANLSGYESDIQGLEQLQSELEIVLLPEKVVYE